MFRMLAHSTLMNMNKQGFKDGSGPPILQGVVGRVLIPIREALLISTGGRKDGRGRTRTDGPGPPFATTTRRTVYGVFAQ